MTAPWSPSQRTVALRFDDPPRGGGRGPVSRSPERGLLAGCDTVGSIGPARTRRPPRCRLRPQDTSVQHRLADRCHPSQPKRFPRAYNTPGPRPMPAVGNFLRRHHRFSRSRSSSTPTMPPPYYQSRASPNGRSTRTDPRARRFQPGAPVQSEPRAGPYLGRGNLLRMQGQLTIQALSDPQPGPIRLNPEGAQAFSCARG